MTDPKDLPPDFTDLRRRAEAQLAAETIPPEKLSPDQAAQLIHELRVLQIELEMQNDELRLSQARMEESRNKYTDLYDFAPVGYLTLDERGRIVEANLTAATLLGMERSKLLGRFFSHFLVDADRRVFRQLMNNSLNLPERRVEVHLQDGNGDVRVMQLNILLLTDAKGHEHRRVSMTDISELKRTQEELRLHKEDLEELVKERTTQLIELQEANAQLEALFQAAPLAIGVFDDQGRVVKVNPASERIFGWSQEEVRGRQPLSIPPEDSEESQAVLQRVLNGESLIGVELKQKRQDGAKIDISLSAAPLYDASGKQRGFIGLADDVTERKKQEEAARTQALVLESMAEGVTVTDQRGYIVYTNPAFDAMFGYGPGELLGRHSNVLNFDPPGKNRSVVKAILEQVDTTGSWTGEFRNCRKNGKPFYTSAHINGLMVGPKKLYISVQEDITQRKRARGGMLQRQAELLELAHDAILVRDLQGRISYWNRGAEELYGWKHSEAMAKVSHQMLATKFPEPLPSIENQVFDKGHWEGELIHTTREGRRVTVASRWSLKRGDDGKPLAILEIGQDVTAQKRIEAEVHRMASFPFLNPNPVLEVDEEGTVTYVNPAARQLATQLGLASGVKAFLPPDLKERLAAARQGGPRQYNFDLALKDRFYTVAVSFPHDLPTARLYATDITERQRADEARRESEERFRLAFENANVGMALVGLDGKYLRVNSALSRMLGYPREELEKMGISDLTYPDDLPLARDFCQQALRGEIDSVYLEKRKLHKNGDIVWVHLASSLVRDAQGRPLYFISQLQDITARKQMEEALRESERRFRQVVESLPQLVWTCQPEGPCDFLSKQWLDYTGIPEAEQLGYGWLYQVHPDDQAGLMQAWKTATASGVDFKVEFRIRRHDGVYHWFDTRGVPLRDESGNIVKWFGSNTDIQARRELREALQESETRLRLAQQAARVGTFAWNIQTGVNTWTPELEAIYGLTPGSFARTQLAWENLIHPDDRAKAVGQVERSLETGEPVEEEWRVIWPDGSIHWVAGRWQVFKDESGRPLRMTGVNIDITERKQVEAELDRVRYLLAEGQRVAHLGSWEYLAETQTTVWSDEEKRIYGLDPAQPSPDYEVMLRHHIHPDDAVELDRSFRAAFQHGALFENENRIIRPDCTVRWIYNKAEPYFDEHGKLLRYIGATLDITERKRAEAALKESEERYRSLFENNHAVMLLIDPDTGAVMEANPAACAYYGYSKEELLARTITDINNLSPEQVKEEMQQARAEKRRHFEFMHRLASGEVREVEVFSGPIRIMGRELLYSIVHDITARKEAEAALRESEARYRAIGELIPYGIWTAGPEGDYQYFSKSFLKMTDKTLEQCQGYGWMNLLPLEDVKPTLEAWQYCLETGGFWDYEYQMRGRDGRYRTILSRGLPLADGTGQITSWVGINLDITERKEMEEALRQARDELEKRVMERTTALRLANEQLLWQMEERQKAEDRLRDSEARFAAFMEHLPGQAVMRDIEGRYLFANLAWEKIMGFEPGAWRGKTLAEVWSPEEAADLQKMDFEIISTGKPKDQVEIMEQADGLHYYLSTHFPILDKDGFPYMVGSIAIDISERRRAEEALAAERQRLFDVLEAMPAMVSLLKPEYRVVFGNRFFREIFGEVQDRPCYEWVFGFDKPCDFCRSFDPIKTGVPGEYEIITKDGRILHIYDYPFADIDGSPMVLEMGIDITARKQADEALKWERQRLYSLLEQIPAYVTLLAPDYTVPFANREFLRRFGEGEEGQKCYESLFGRDKPCPDCRTFKVLEENQPQEWEWLGPDGRTYAVYDYPFTDADGSPLILEMGVDITDRKQAEKALRASEQRLRFLADQLLTAQENERKRLAAELHDELGHALLALKLHLSSIEKKIPPEQEGIKQEIRSQLEYINEVIQDVRRLYHDLSPGDVEDLGLTKALRTLINDFAMHVPEIAWQVDLADLEGLFSLPVQTIIYRIVQEALTNIGKHAHPTLVTISCQKKAGEVHFVVQDNGAGFNVQDLGAQGTGRGLGLVAMEERLNMLGGAFEILSREQEGTRLSFTIPILPEGETMPPKNK